MQSIILAAGQGTRMHSTIAKVLHPVLGKPMINHVLDHLELANIERKVVVIGHGAEQVKATIGDRNDVEFVVQTEQLGTGHAVMVAKELLKDEAGETIVICGDTPLITPQTINRLYEYHREKSAAATVLTTDLDNPFSYGRIVRGKDGELLKIVEEKDASDEERTIREINTGTYCFDNRLLFEALDSITNQNEQGEYYLTDVIEILRDNGHVVAAYKTEDHEETLGINDRVTLAKANKIMQRRVNEQFMRFGVTIIDPESTFISTDTVIGKDTTIHPGTIIMGQNVIGQGCNVGPYSELTNVVLKDNVTVRHSVVSDSVVGSHTTIGPFAQLRNQARIGEKVRIGNFVEIKNTVLGDESKTSHLSYLGDSEVGKRVNIGCGTITVNYNGVEKFKTTVEDDAFIGCNSNLIAPVTIGKGSTVGAGSTITEDVPEESLAIARSRQVNKVDYFKNKNKKLDVQ